VIEALRTRRPNRLPVAEPSDEELAEQLPVELPVSRRHLRSVLDTYWDRRSRRGSTAYDETPDSRLWRAATAVEDILGALDALDPPSRR
jgi:hypothetical protein